MGYDSVTRRQAVQMVLDGTNFRRVARLLGVNHQSVVNWFRRATTSLTPKQAPRPEVGDDDTVELDELFTFVGAKKTKSTWSRKSTGRRAVS
jgi:transposase-like protein